MADADRFTLDIREVLGEVPTDQLKAFVERYGRRHKDFLYAMLVHFARQSDKGQDEKKYEYLFYKILRAYLPSGSKPLKKKIKTVLSLYKVLLNHARDALALENYRESYQILRPGIVFTKLLLRRSKGMDPSVPELFTDYHKYLGQLINQPIPPPLKDEIRAFCMQHSLAYDYAPPSVVYNLFAFATRLMDEKSIAHEYAIQLIKLISEGQGSRSELQFVKCQLFELLQTWQFGELVDRVLKERYIRTEDQVSIVRFLSDKGKKEEALSAVDRFIRGTKGDTYAKLRHQEIGLRVDRGDPVREILELLHDLVDVERSVKPMFRYIPRLDLGEEDRSKLLDAMGDNRAYEVGESDMIRLMLLLEKEEEAFEILRHSGDAKRIVRLLSSFGGDRRRDLADILIRLTVDELSASYGKAGAEKVESILNMMAREGLTDERERLADAVRKAFPKRKSLRIVSL